MNLAALAEALLFFAACQAYLWWVHLYFPAGRLLLLFYLIGSVIGRGRSLRELGLDIRADARGVMHLAGWPLIGVMLGVLAYGFARGRVGPTLPDGQVLRDFGGYLLWCVAQQFALQSFLHNRLMDAFPGRQHFTSLLAALMFASLHLPSPVLVIATLVGGWALSEIFARHRNIWLLAAFQALVSTALIVAFPYEVLHGLRVGPGYYRWTL